MEFIDISHTNEIYTVSRLNREVKLMLEGTFPMMWVEGEISNFAAPSSGHWYFSLKDPLAQIRCAMFRPQNRQLSFIPKDGMQVLIKTRVSLYEGRGDFQLLVEHMEEAGIGKLRQEFEALKRRLHEMGLFSDMHKKQLPAFPQTIGIITSATGAAIRDILSVLARRYACAKIIIYPTLVQGETAAPAIITAIQTANRREECDVLILARGGGSLEDLWPFNEEKVAYAIHHSVIPIISGIGHEVDFTIADFVADMRAATPSAAAEVIAPHAQELLDSLHQQKRHILRILQQKLQHCQQAMVWIKKHLQQQHPKRRLAEQAQRLDLAEMTLQRLQNNLLATYAAKLKTLMAELGGLTPKHKLHELSNQLEHSTKILYACTNRLLRQKQQLLANLGAKLDALSPLSTLKRGYAVAIDDKNNQVIWRANDLQIGDNIQVHLMEGALHCVVKKIDAIKKPFSSDFSDNH